MIKFTISIVVVVNTPYELVKCKQQLNLQKYLSTREALKEIYRINGIRSLYRGFCVSLNRDVFSYGIYFYSFYILKDYWESEKSLSNFKLMFAGGIAGILSWILTYPFDTLKTIIQVNDGNKTLTQLEAYYHLVNQTNSSFKSLFKGLCPTILRAFITNSVIFYTNEMCLDYMNKL